MAQIIWAVRAVKDLKTINEYISHDSEIYAKRFISKLIERVDILINSH